MTYSIALCLFLKVSSDCAKNKDYRAYSLVLTPVCVLCRRRRTEWSRWAGEELGWEWRRAEEWSASRGGRVAARAGRASVLDPRLAAPDAACPPVTVVNPYPFYTPVLCFATASSSLWFTLLTRSANVSSTLSTTQLPITFLQTQLPFYFIQIICEVRLENVAILP